MFDDVVREWLAEAKRRPNLAATTKMGYSRIAHTSSRGPASRVTLTRSPTTSPPAGRHLGAAPPPVLPRVRIDPRVSVLNHRTPTPPEAAAALGAMPRDEWHLAARIVAATGARVGEVMALRSVDLDVTTGRLALGATEGASKTGMRWFPLDSRTRGKRGARA